MKAFKSVFLAAALLTSVPMLTLVAPSGYAQVQQNWYVLAKNPNPGPLFIQVGAPSGTRTEANTLVESIRDTCLTGVHMVPEQAWDAQKNLGLIETSPPAIELLCPSE